MNVNADLSQRAVVDTHRIPWERSPSGSVWRKPLYRLGGEFGAVTSLVRYAPGGVFPEHAHPEGEEILVLDGVFSDEHGDYPAGTFLIEMVRSHSRATLLADHRRVALESTAIALVSGAN